MGSKNPIRSLMKYSRLVCIAVVSSFVATGCAAETDDVAEETATPTVAVKADEVEPKWLTGGCGLATVGMTMNVRNCERTARGSGCTTHQGTCGLHWVGWGDGFQFYWTYRFMSYEWIPVGNEVQ